MYKGGFGIGLLESCRKLARQISLGFMSNFSTLYGHVMVSCVVRDTD